MSMVGKPGGSWSSADRWDKQGINNILEMSGTTGVQFLLLSLDGFEMWICLWFVGGSEGDLCLGASQM